MYHLLIVDDEPMNLSVAKSIFKHYGMEVTTASSGQEAVMLCRSRKFDVVFMDSFTKATTKSVTTSKTSTTLKNLKKGTTYYVKVRAYVTDASKDKVYGAYGTVKSVKVK